MATVTIIVIFFMLPLEISKYEITQQHVTIGSSAQGMLHSSPQTKPRIMKGMKSSSPYTWSTSVGNAELQSAIETQDNEGNLLFQLVYCGTEPGTSGQVLQGIPTHLTDDNRRKETSEYAHRSKSKN